jgi:hypothetical protein
MVGGQLPDQWQADFDNSKLAPPSFPAIPSKRQFVMAHYPKCYLDCKNSGALPSACFINCHLQYFLQSNIFVVRYLDAGDRHAQQ